ncbi:hypothetical protein BJ875DRAFT_436288 [Amylocarpus encephaloides]|uniref:Uncharacterized protein n=1 Tax=Amylocarpus encephaloides TaxID=45428 RepID=A0A9P7YVC9_9HELO|nr:hypothetical protein BJ875DRAFT_436288 [Amylocarpus encephaloides]
MTGEGRNWKRCRCLWDNGWHERGVASVVDCNPSMRVKGAGGGEKCRDQGRPASLVVEDNVEIDNEEEGRGRGQTVDDSSCVAEEGELTGGDLTLNAGPTVQQETGREGVVSPRSRTLVVLPPGSILRRTRIKRIQSGPPAERPSNQSESMDLLRPGTQPATADGKVDQNAVAVVIPGNSQTGGRVARTRGLEEGGPGSVWAADKENLRCAGPIADGRIAQMS